MTEFRTGKRRDVTTDSHPVNGKEKTNIAPAIETDVFIQKWKLVRAFKNKEEADEEMERLMPIRKEFKVRVVEGNNIVYPFEVQIRKKTLKESLS